MANATHDEVIAATRMWLAPVIHILLRSGVTWKEFAELSKMTYVDVATRHFGRRNRPTNVSRTAMLTGLVRRDVRKQRELLEDGRRRAHSLRHQGVTRAVRMASSAGIPRARRAVRR